MKAIVLSRYGEPEDLRLQELPKPEPKNGEVLVKVHATAVNDWDWCYISGKPYVYRLMFGLFKPKTAVLGAEVAGTVEAVGAGATRFQTGDRVYGDISLAGFGGFAEYACLPEHALHPMPTGMGFEQAASLPHAAMLALQALVDVGHIAQGEQVLVNGAGGGVGVIALQIAKQYGAEVTGVDCASKLEMLRAVGYDHVIDYRAEDFTRNGRRYDLIVDAQTTRSPRSHLRSLKPGGRYVTIGGHLPKLIQCLIMGPFIARLSSKRVHLVDLKPNKNLDYVNELFASHGLKCVIDGPYPLSDVPKAVRRFGEAKHIGKVVIAVAA